MATTVSLLVTKYSVHSSPTTLPKGDNLKCQPVMVLSSKPRASSGRIIVSTSDPGLSPLYLEIMNEKGKLSACHGPKIQEGEEITGLREYFSLSGRRCEGPLPWNLPSPLFSWPQSLGDFPFTVFFFSHNR